MITFLILSLLYDEHFGGFFEVLKLPFQEAARGEWTGLILLLALVVAEDWPLAYYLLGGAA